MASIKDVAKRAGVGVGTVSRTLNNTGYVAKETREKIMLAMQELEYTPNELARNLFHNRTGIVGIIIPDLEHPFFAAFCKEVEMELYQHGYKAMICNTIEESNREQEYLDMLQRNIVDGLITGAHSLNDEAYLKVKKPVVGFDRTIGPQVPVISSDHAQGGRLAAQKFLEDGCTKVIATTEEIFQSSPSLQNAITFAAELRKNGVEVILLERAWNDFRVEYFYDNMRRFLEKHPDVDGIYSTDLTAIAAVKILKGMGRKVPDDVRVMGYDATSITRIVEPPVTAIKQNIPQLARACVTTLLKMIDGEEDVPSQQLFSVEMQYGKTTF